VRVEELPGSAAGQLVVRVSNGIATVSTTSEAFQVEEPAPTALILDPTDGAEFAEGVQIPLHGMGADSDGALSDASLSWRSDRSGMLGTGRSLTVTLPKGSHILTLHADGRSGTSSEQSIRVDVVAVEEDGSHGQCWWGGAVGSAHPRDRLNTISDAGIYGQLDIVHLLSTSLAVRLALGFSQFTAEPALPVTHPHYTHLSANLQWLTPGGAASRLFINGGPGLYRDEGGSTTAGGNIGAGVQIDVSSMNKLELGADYHFVGDNRGRFVAWHLGILASW
jgi:hypothetical protein